MPNTVTFSLPESLTIHHVVELHAQLETLMGEDEHDGITLSACDVHKTDTAGLQLLLLFVNEAKNNKFSVTWDSPSDTLCDSARLIGIKESLGLQ